MPKTTPLAELRDKIDKIDSQILKLINNRATYAIEAAKTKSFSGESDCFYSPDREALVLRRIKELNLGPLSNNTVVRLFRELMSSCLELEKPLEVAFLGPAGTFTQQAAIKHFGLAVKTTSASSIDEIFTKVERRHSQFGVVPIENSTAGVITHTLDRFVDSSLKICGEVEIRVHQNLMGHTKNLNVITEVYSHQQSLNQCNKWLLTYLPNVLRTQVNSNAEAARLASNSQNKVAIASAVSANLYKLQIIKKNIEDEPNNTTRFIVIGNQESKPTGLDKTSLLISASNYSGSLHKILQPFSQFGISLSHIESRPSKQRLWDYVFFIDINGHKDDENVANALKELVKNTNYFNILGSYPKAVL